MWTCRALRAVGGGVVAPHPVDQGVGVDLRPLAQHQRGDHAALAGREASAGVPAQLEGSEDVDQGSSRLDGCHTEQRLPAGLHGCCTPPDRAFTGPLPPWSTLRPRRRDTCSNGPGCQLAGRRAVPRPSLRALSAGSRCERGPAFVISGRGGCRCAEGRRRPGDRSGPTGGPGTGRWWTRPGELARPCASSAGRPSSTLADPLSLSERPGGAAVGRSDSASGPVVAVAGGTRSSSSIRTRPPCAGDDLRPYGLSNYTLTQRRRRPRSPERSPRASVTPLIFTKLADCALPMNDPARTTPTSASALGRTTVAYEVGSARGRSGPAAGTSRVPTPAGRTLAGLTVARTSTRPSAAVRPRRAPVLRPPASARDGYGRPARRRVHATCSAAPPPTWRPDVLAARPRTGSCAPDDTAAIRWLSARQCILRRVP